MVIGQLGVCEKHSEKLKEIRKRYVQEMMIVFDVYQRNVIDSEDIFVG